MHRALALAVCRSRQGSTVALDKHRDGTYWLHVRCAGVVETPAEEFAAHGDALAAFEATVRALRDPPEGHN
jgi:hypothetical protein